MMMFRILNKLKRRKKESVIEPRSKPMGAPHFQIHEPAGLYKPHYGDFGKYDKANKALTWIACRETFHSYADDDQKFYEPDTKNRYYFVVINPDPIMDMVGWVEDTIGVKDKTRFHYQENYRPKGSTGYNILQVEPGPFWKAQPIRHAFLTCALKASLTQSGRGHRETLHQCKYFHATSTWNAAQRFLGGDTWLTPPNGVRRKGWVLTFTPFTSQSNPQSNYHYVLEHILNRPNEQSVKERAKELWVQSGWQHGRDLEFWTQAKKEVYGY
jgi:hypothetical protein